MTDDGPTVARLDDATGEGSKPLERITIGRPRPTEPGRIYGNSPAADSSSDGREVRTRRTEPWPQQHRALGGVAPLTNRDAADQSLPHAGKPIGVLISRSTDPVDKSPCDK